MRKVCPTPGSARTRTLGKAKLPFGTGEARLNRMLDSELSLSQLRCFVAVVDFRSLTEAARQLGMSPASMSKAITRLEQTSGVKLFHRSTHALSLSQDGERLVGAAREAVRAASVFSKSAGARHQDGTSGWIRITAAVAFAREVLTPLLADFGREHPTVRIDLRATNELVDLARDGVDLAIRSGSLADLPGHLQSLWFKFPWVVCAAPQYLSGKPLPSRPEDIAQHRLIGFRNQHTGQVRAWTFCRPGADAEEIRIVPEPAMIFDDGAAAALAGIQGAGLIAAPLWLVAGALEAGQLVELLSDWRAADVPISFLRRERHLVPERVDKLIAFLRARPPLAGD
jgi:DNA-binding transcriptional LysR family regulator